MKTLLVHVIGEEFSTAFFNAAECGQFLQAKLETGYGLDRVVEGETAIYINLKGGEA